MGAPNDWVAQQRFLCGLKMVIASRSILTASVLVLVLTGCGGGSSDFKGTDPDTVFSLGTSPYHFLAGLDFRLTGTDRNEDQWSGRLMVSSLGDTSFQGQSAEKFRLEISLIHGPSGGTSTQQETVILDVEGNVLTWSDSLGVTCSPASLSTSDYPSTAKPGDSGTLGTMLCSDDTTRSGTWDLLGAEAPYAYLTINENRSRGPFSVASREMSLLIRPSGDVEDSRIILRPSPLDALDGFLDLRGSPS